MIPLNHILFFCQPGLLERQIRNLLEPGDRRS